MLFKYGLNDIPYMELEDDQNEWLSGTACASPCVSSILGNTSRQTIDYAILRQTSTYLLLTLMIKRYWTAIKKT
jgi:hypothetical protein